jgi:hypothetical protein
MAAGAVTFVCWGILDHLEPSCSHSSRHLLFLLELLSVAICYEGNTELARPPLQAVYIFFKAADARAALAPAGNGTTLRRSPTSNGALGFEFNHDPRRIAGERSLRSKSLNDPSSRQPDRIAAG